MLACMPSRAEVEDGCLVLAGKDLLHVATHTHTHTTQAGRRRTLLAEACLPYPLLSPGIACLQSSFFFRCLPVCPRARLRVSRLIVPIAISCLLLGCLFNAYPAPLCARFARGGTRGRTRDGGIGHAAGQGRQQRGGHGGKATAVVREFYLVPAVLFETRQGRVRGVREAFRVSVLSAQHGGRVGGHHGAGELPVVCCEGCPFDPLQVKFRPGKYYCTDMKRLSVFRVCFVSRRR